MCGGEPVLVAGDGPAHPVELTGYLFHNAVPFSVVVIV